MCITFNSNGEISVETTPVKPERAEKGKSLIDFPSDYTVIDLETTGYSPIYDDIIELCAIKVRNNKITEKFSSLVNRDSEIYVDSFVTELTGITQEMVDNAPDIKSVLPNFIDFISSDIVIGHNVNFDVNFIYDASMSILGKPFTNDFIDTMRISRRLHPEQRHHRLSDLAERYSIDYTGAHRSERDCEITKLCYAALSDDVLNTYGNYTDFFPTRRQRNQYIKAEDILSTNIVPDKSHVLYGKVCVFTGALEKMTRKEAMQIVANLGGINANSVTKKTNYLILGCNDYYKSIKDGKSNKQKRAEQLQLEGQDICILSEDVFYDMIEISEAAEFEVDNKPFYDQLQNILDDIITNHNLPQKSIHLYSNISHKGDNAGKEMSKSICIFEPEYPPRKDVIENPGKNFVVMNLKPAKDNRIELLIRNKQFNSIDTPPTASVKKLKSDKSFVHVFFEETDDSVFTYIRQNILYCLANYESSNRFACCSRFIQCSDAKACVHENRIYSMGCQYRRNLEAGRIFYGKNKNID